MPRTFSPESEPPHQGDHRAYSVRDAAESAVVQRERWIELRIPGADTRVVLFTPEGQEDRIGTFQSIAFYSADVKKTYEELKSKGVEFAGPPQIAEWGSSAIFKDRDGNQFALSPK